jgi:uncharacterized membrane protein YfcA
MDALMEFNAEVFIVAGTVSFFAAFLHGSIGLGFPMVATPLLALITDIQTAIILTIIPSFLTNLVSIKSEGKLLSASSRYISLALFVMAGSAIGTQVLILTSSEFFKALLAVAIILYLFSDKINFNLTWVVGHQTFSRFVFGIFAGILGGLTNVMAPILIIYTLESKHSKSDTIQALNFCFLFGKLTQFILFSINGKFSLDKLSISSVMFITASLALYIGINIRKKIELSTYRKILRIVLLILSVLLLIQVSMIVTNR